MVVPAVFVVMLVFYLALFRFEGVKIQVFHLVEAVESRIDFCKVIVGRTRILLLWISIIFLGLVRLVLAMGDRCE